MISFVCECSCRIYHLWWPFHVSPKSVPLSLSLARKKNLKIIWMEGLLTRQFNKISFSSNSVSFFHLNKSSSLKWERHCNNNNNSNNINWENGTIEKSREFSKIFEMSFHISDHYSIRSFFNSSNGKKHGWRDPHKNNDNLLWNDPKLWKAHSRTPHLYVGLTKQWLWVYHCDGRKNNVIFSYFFLVYKREREKKMESTHK